MDLTRLSPTTRQTTRALQEIQSQRASLVDVDVLETPAPSTLHPMDITDRLSSTSNTCGGQERPSPDEAVIMARGRRLVPITFSPDIRVSPARTRTTATSNLATVMSSRLMLPVTRSSPRKRLRLQDSPPERQTPLPIISSLYSPSPDKQRRSPVAKRLRLSPTSQQPTSSSVRPDVAIKALSHAQLTSLVTSLLTRHPDLTTEVNRLIPTPDLSHHEDNLNFLKKNIYKALPSSRLLDSKNDSFAYNRVSVHLLAFKKTLSDGLKSLVESQQWTSVVDYVTMAWAFVRSTPVWNNPCHNTIRRTCFKSLSLACLKALKEGNLCSDPEDSKRILNKLDRMKVDSDEILICRKYVEFMASSRNNNL